MINKFTKVWRAWIASRPLLSLITVFVYGIGVGLIAAGDFSEKYFWILSMVFVSTVMVFAIKDNEYLSKVWKGALGLVLSLALIPNSQAQLSPESYSPYESGIVYQGFPEYSIFPQEDPVIRPAAGAVVVGVGLGLIVGCGYVCYRVIDTCSKKKKFVPPPPRNTNAQDFTFTLNAGDGGGGGEECDGYGGSYMWQTDYCSVLGGDDFAAAMPLPDAVFYGVQVTVTISYGGEPKIVNLHHYSDSELLTFEKDQEVMSKDHGITWNGLGGNSQYTKNGQPTDRSIVPFTIGSSWDPLVTLYPSQPQHRFFVEASSDLETWERKAHVSMPVGQNFLFQETTESPARFYRVVSDQVF